MKKMLIMSLSLLIFLLSSANIFSAEPNKPAEPNVPAKPAVPKDANYVVATYEGKNLTIKEVNYLAPGSDFDTIKNVADFWINSQLLYDEAVKKALDKDAKIQFMADIAFKKSIASAYIEQVQNAIQVNDVDIKKYYDQNKDTDPRLKEPLYLSFSHITVDTNEQAMLVKSKLEKGEEINELAKTMSVASDAKKGGRAAKYKEDTVRMRFGDSFADALLKASEGDIIGPIKDKDGKFEIARHEGKRMPHVIEFDKVKEQIKSTLTNERKRKATEDTINSLRENAKGKYQLNGIFAEQQKTEKEKKSEK